MASSEHKVFTEAVKTECDHYGVLCSSEEEIRTSERPHGNTERKLSLSLERGGLGVPTVLQGGEDIASSRDSVWRLKQATSPHTRATKGVCYKLP